MSEPLYLLEVLAKLAGVLLLFIGGILILKRWPGLAPSGKRVRRLTVIETVRLSPRQSLHLVRAGSQTLLVGATDQAVSLVSTVDLEDISIEVSDQALDPGEQPAPQPLHLPASWQFRKILLTLLRPGDEPCSHE